jgi:sugar lactone lactonase YvrE
MTAKLPLTSNTRGLLTRLGVFALGLAAITAQSSVTPSISVTGPNGYTQAMTATTMLTGLAAGSYTVTATPATGSNAIVGTLSTAVVSGSPASVSVGSPDTVTVTYATRGGSGGLWVANFGAGTALEYAASQLAATGSGAPATAVATGDTAFNFAVAFDANGNLWTATYLNGSILEFSASDLAKSGSPTPTVSIRDSIPGNASAGAPVGLAFDANGNLWVSDLIDSSVEEYTPSQLSSSGKPSPALVLTSSSHSLSQPTGLAFDSTGNLWVANLGTNSLVKFAASELAHSGSPTPAITLSQNAADSSIYGPLSMAFDPTGNLWLSNGNFDHNGPNTVVMFSPTQLATSSSAAPTIVLRAGGGSLVGPGGLAFDASGNLWVTNVDTNTVVEYTASQLVSSGSPTPNVTISGSSLNFPAGIAFNPHASALPIKPAVRGGRGRGLEPMKAR